MKTDKVDWPISVTVQAIVTLDQRNRPFLLVGADEDGRTVRFIAAHKSNPAIGDKVLVFGHTITAWVGGPYGPWADAMREPVDGHAKGND